MMREVAEEGDPEPEPLPTMARLTERAMALLES